MLRFTKVWILDLIVGVVGDDFPSLSFSIQRYVELGRIRRGDGIVPGRLRNIGKC